MSKEYYQKLLLSKGVDKKFLIKRESEAVEKKKRLLEIARKGEPRPNYRKHPLGNVLCNYTNPNRKCYDEKFTNELKHIRLDWFITQFDIANDKKKQLLEMARNGEPKPIYMKDRLGLALKQYTNPKNSSYDEKFTNELKKIRHDWIIDTADEKKKQLLKMAKHGEVKPICGKHPLGESLSHYINPKRCSYDEEFIKELKKIRPDWFVNKVDKNKEKLLEMAKNGESRPSCTKHPLGTSLYMYTSPKRNTYDEKLTEKLKKIRPDWFVTRFDEMDDKKKQLLEMVKRGEPRPSKNKHLLGIALCNYINPKKSCYDDEFTKKIKSINPDWLMRQSEIANDKKKQLLKMAKCGEPRPNRMGNNLGKVLSNYISPKNNCYDEEFTKKIRKIRPDWFKK